jgi:dolichyl-phosphate beta-glucosyltransferase
MQLIIPAYNEAARLPRTLEALRAHVLGAAESVGFLSVLVVDNNSVDGTADVALAASTPLLPVQVLHCAEQGKGAAVRAGVAAGDADVVVFMDADGATDLGALLDAARLLEAGADVAVGSRALPGSVTWERHTRARAVGAHAYRRLTRSIVPGIVDTQCGFKAFRGDLAREVFAATRTRGFSFDVEVLARCHAAGARVVEFPVTWVDVPGSTFVPARHGASSFLQLADIALRMRAVRARSAASVSVLPAVPAQSRPVAELELAADL